MPSPEAKRARLAGVLPAMKLARRGLEATSLLQD